MKRLLWLIPLLTIHAVSGAGELAQLTGRFPSVPPPPQGSLQWIAKSMRVNGMPMRIQSLHSKLGPESVLQYYESWSKLHGGDRTMRSSVHGWQTLAMSVERHLVSIQVRRDMTETYGTVTTTPMSRTSQSRRARSTFPTPTSTQVVNWQQYEDEGAEAEHISLISERTSQVEAQAFSRLLRDKAWTIVREQPMREQGHGHVIEAQKATQLAQITLLNGRGPASRTRILVVWKKS
jgi:hypothetical protein